jgi:hypothetical protein
MTKAQDQAKAGTTKIQEKATKPSGEALSEDQLAKVTGGADPAAGLPTGKRTH